MSSECSPASLEAVVEKMVALHQKGISEHLQGEGGRKKGQEFDCQNYFKVLTHISVRDGYTLDYFCHHQRGWGSEPYLYVRRTDEKPFETFGQWTHWEKQQNPLAACLLEENTVESALMLLTVRTSTRTDMLVPYLVADGTSQGFFELVLFRLLAG